MKPSVLGALLSSAIFAAFALPGPAIAADACDAIAQAKSLQWRQLHIRRTRELTMADGATKTDDMILTSNTMYFQAHGRWYSGQMTLRERGIASPETVAQRLSLTDCQVSGHEQRQGKLTTVYTYRSQSDDFNAGLKIWIADDSGLPLRAEMRNTAPRGNQAQLIAADYTYGDDVKLPSGAEMADARRRFFWRRTLDAAQMGQGFK